MSSEERKLLDDLAQARAAAAPAPVTVDECRRVVAMLKDHALVDVATQIRCMEFLLTKQPHPDAVLIARQALDVPWETPLPVRTMAREILRLTGERRHGVASKSLWDRRERRAHGGGSTIVDPS